MTCSCVSRIPHNVVLMVKCFWNRPTPSKKNNYALLNLLNHFSAHCYINVKKASSTEMLLKSASLKQGNYGPFCKRYESSMFGQQVIKDDNTARNKVESSRFQPNWHITGKMITFPTGKLLLSILKSMWLWVWRGCNTPWTKLKEL